MKEFPSPPSSRLPIRFFNVDDFPAHAYGYLLGQAVITAVGACDRALKPLVFVRAEVTAHLSCAGFADFAALCRDLPT